MSGNKDIVVGIRLTADGDQLVGEVKLSKKEIDALGNSVERTDKKTSKFSKTTAAAARNVALMAAAAAGAAAAYSIKKTVDFEKAISDLSAITGATGDRLKYLTIQAQEFGASTTMSASQAAEAFKLVASAKPDLLDNAAALAAVTRETITLAEAAGISLPESARTLGASLNQFNADADQSTRFINVLAAGAKFGASEIEQTAQALKESGTVAASANISFESTNALLQLLAGNAIKGAQAGTGLRGVILKLQNQANDGFNPAIVGINAALQNLQDAHLSTTQKMKLFGLEGITSAEILIKNAGAVGTLTDKLTGTNTAYEQARTRTNNLSGDVDRLTSAVEAQAIIFGSNLTPSMRTLVLGFADVIKAEKQTTEGLSNIQKNASELAVVVGKVADVVGNAAKGIAFPFEAVGGAIGAVAGQLVALAQGELRQAITIGEAWADSMTAKLNAMSDPTISSRYENMAKKIIESNRRLNASGAATNTASTESSAPNQAVAGASSTTPSDTVLKDAAALTEQMDSAFLDMGDRAAKRYTEMYDKLQAKGSAGNQALKSLTNAYSNWLDEQGTANDEKIMARQAAQDERVISLQQSKFDRLAAVAADVGASEEEREINRYDLQAEKILLEEEQLRTALGSRFDMEAQFRQAKEQALAIHENNIQNIENKSQSAQKKLWDSGLKGKAAVMGQVLTGMASMMQSGSRRMFEIGKVAATAEATITGARAVLSAFAWGSQIGGPIGGGIAAAAAAIPVGIQIAKIASAKFGGGASASTAPSVSAGGASFASGGNGQQSSAVTPSYAADTAPQQPAPQPIYIINKGNVMTSEFMDNQVIPYIQNRVGNNDVQLIPAGSRNEQEIIARANSR